MLPYLVLAFSLCFDRTNGFTAIQQQQQQRAFVRTSSRPTSISGSKRSYSTQLKAATTASFSDYYVDQGSVVAEEAFVDTDQETKIGVLLLNLGGPETGDDVEGERKTSFHTRVMSFLVRSFPTYARTYMRIILADRMFLSDAERPRIALHPRL